MKQAAAPTAYTPEQAEAYDGLRFADAEGLAIHRTEFEQLKLALDRIAKSGQALEVGCGTGRLLLEGWDAGYHIDGMDASPDMLAQLERKLAGRTERELNLQIGEAAKLPYDNSSYDLVYAIRLLNQTESPEYALRVVVDMLRVAKPGGYVLAEFVNERRPRLGRNKRPTTRLDPKAVEATGREHGARVIWTHGAFLFGMGALRAAPGFLVPLVRQIDRAFARLFPRYCSRVYVLLRKAEVR
ncbi:MAG: class I SAM-dependent methyltransferase [Phycisphaerales bacterium]